MGPASLASMIWRSLISICDKSFLNPAGKNDREKKRSFGVCEFMITNLAVLVRLLLQRQEVSAQASKKEGRLLTVYRNL